MLLSPKPGSSADQIHALREDALKPATNIIASVNPTGKDKHVMKKVSEINFDHGLLMPNKAFFHQYPKSLGLGRKFGQINLGAFGVFSIIYQHPFWSMFSINQPLFLQKPKYLFEIGI